MCFFQFQTLPEHSDRPQGWFLRKPVGILVLLTAILPFECVGVARNLKKRIQITAIKVEKILPPLKKRSPHFCGMPRNSQKISHFCQFWDICHAQYDQGSINNRTRPGRIYTFFCFKYRQGSPSQGSEHPRMFRRHFSVATFPSTLCPKPVSDK